ncbi:hypothetical protein PaecuDRAFT_4259 [Paenibacillus curdlanolyticus YK9]|uniref:Uncharacterized protein n=1 Tax=Paenibacillus curdlanolyticus YK9 TaxID=717606 RepID=E0IF18_9BACL|nr:hypothetical protein [Paenibacillus curdlanolyticus]EFM08794.1 hypothetical protein PaecuDRAFT_4259 [Paenibacillus curdlanolyticus YK9]
MNLDFFAKLTDKELCAAYEGEMEWMESSTLAEDNPLRALCENYEVESGEEIDLAEAIDAVLYEMATRYYKSRVKL